MCKEQWHTHTKCKEQWDTHTHRLANKRNIWCCWKNMTQVCSPSLSNVAIATSSTIVMNTGGANERFIIMW